MLLMPRVGPLFALRSKLCTGKSEQSVDEKHPDRCRDSDGEWGVREYSGTDEDRTKWQAAQKWFGCATHLVVDSRYELPVSFSVRRANAHEVVVGHGLLERLEEHLPEIVERYGELAADRLHSTTPN